MAESRTLPLGVAARAPRREAGAAPAPAAAGRPAPLLFWAVILYFVLEYARPPVIVQFKLQMLIALVLPFFWISTRERPASPILMAQLLFFAFTITAVPVSHNYYSAYMVSRTIFGHVSLALGMSWILSHIDLYRQAIWVWLLIMLYVAFFAITHGGTGPGGFLGDENDLALACLTAFGLAFFGFEHLPGWRRWASGAIGVTLVIAIIVSFSRGGFLGLGVTGLYCFLTSRHKARNLAVALAAVLAFFALAPADYIEEIQTITETDEGTAKGRKFLWITAWNMWKDNKVRGVGGGNYNFLAGDYPPEEGFEEREYRERNWSGTTTHSLYFQVLAEQGLIGSVLFLAIWWYHFAMLRRLRRDARRSDHLPPDLKRDVEIYAPALGAGMVGFMAAGAFLSVTYYPYMYYFSALAVALDASVRRELPAKPAAGAGAPDSA